MGTESLKIAALPLLLATIAVALLAQAPAGGKWTYEVSEDKLTGALYGTFELTADEKITDGI
jgi:hypothetical protein